jgi:endoribonuclease LACTB2
VNPLTEAASVLLARGPGSPEVYAVRRASALRFFGDFIAFPGGKVAPEDASLAPPRPATADPATRALDVRRVTAARELFEETGVLVARRSDGTFPPTDETLVRLRTELAEGRLGFAEVLGQLGVAVRADDFTFAGTLVTPPFTTTRFDTAFFVAELPPGQRAEVWPGELDQGRWTSADDLLAAWVRGECLVSPPTVALLELVRGRPIAECPERLAPLLAAIDRGALHPIFFAPAVRMIPLHTVALLPTTHTNAFLVGTEPRYLIDPGPDAAVEQQRLFDLLDGPEVGGRLTAIVLTHHHPDHVGAAAVCAARYQVPVWAHRETARLLEGKVRVDRFLDEGDRLDLGPAPDGRGAWHLEAVLTPGHAPGHLAFWEPRYRLFFAGDLVSTQSSVVIAPPDGDLAVYLGSLERAKGFDARLLLPAHGSPSPRPRAVLDEAIAHRVKREGQLVEALAAGPRTEAELVAELYHGLPAGLTRLAELQVRAGLLKLLREGRAEEEDKRWRLPS